MHLAEYYMQDRTADLIKKQIEGIRFPLSGDADII